MKSSKHVVIITPGFPEDEKDDSCIPPLQQFIYNFNKINTEIIFSVIAIHYPYINNEYKWNGINVYSCGGKNNHFPYRIKIWKEAINYSDKIYSTENIDLIHSFWLGECSLIGHYLSRKYNIPHINTIMGQELESNNIYLKLIKRKNIFNVAVSEKIAEKFKQMTGKKVDKIIHWGIDQKDRIDKHYERKIDLLGVGSLIKLKNFGLFLDVINNLIKDFPNLQAVIIGEGEEKSEIEKMIKKFNLSGNIKLTGKLKRKDVLKYMRMSKILLHTSIYESFGYVFAEALLNGMYIVSFDVGVAKPGEKWKVVRNEIDIINSVKELLNSELKFNSINLFSIEDTINKYYEVYERSFTL